MTIERSMTGQGIAIGEAVVSLTLEGYGDRPGVRSLGAVTKGQDDARAGDRDHSGDARQGQDGMTLTPMSWGGGIFRHFIDSSVYRAVVSFPSLPVPDPST